MERIISNAPNWPGQIAQLKQRGSSTVTQLYACFGGGGTVQDFSTIKQIFDGNNGTFKGTQLQKNLEVFRQTFPAFDGIDMDCEDEYDLPSFVAFCEMMIGMGFDITFCPYMAQEFWNEALKRIDKAHPGTKVKWWNLQCYDGGNGNNPADWSPPGAPPGYIIPGDWVRFWDPQHSRWVGDCPRSHGGVVQDFLRLIRGRRRFRL